LSRSIHLQASKDASQGIIDADLGGGIIKHRIARPGAGSPAGSGQSFCSRSARLLFVYGFAKSERSNIESDELKAFRKLASVMLAYDEEALTAAVGEGALMEVMCDQEAI